MAKSMTGFGISEFSLNGNPCKIEIKTVNHRYCDIKVKTPFQSLEILQKIEDILQKKISRGTVNVLIRVNHYNDNISSIRLNEELLISYLDALNRLKAIAGLEEEISLNTVIGFKDIFEFVKKEEGADLWDTIMAALEEALDNLILSREEEGNRIMKDILKRIDRMKVIVKEIEKDKNLGLKEYQEKLQKKIKVFSQDTPLDEGRIEMEVAILAQKSDISEEIVRLKSHLSQLRRITGNRTPIGRKIEFYTQEIGREINTIGAKSSQKETLSRVIHLKDELEKVKEQSRNIE